MLTRVVVASALLFAARAGAAPTVVSIDFDDGWFDGYQQASALEAHGMRATYFIITSYTGGKAGYMTLDQIRTLASSGHEIGSHTVTHPDLTLLPADEAQREICASRDMLLSNGFDVQSFAYPYGSSNGMEGLASACGFNSARTIGFATNGAVAETIPPVDPFATQAPASIQVTNSLADIEGQVQAAEATGGWIALVFHRVCDNACDQWSITPANFNALLDWLQARSALGTVVKTHGEIIGGTTQPAVEGPPPTARTGTNLALNPSLESIDANGTPTCWLRNGWGNNVATWRTVAGYDGAFAQQVTVSSFTDGGQRLMPRLDLGQCAPPAAPGHAYTATGFYKGTGKPLWVFVYRTSNGQWVWFAQASSYLPAASNWTQTSLTSPPLPPDASAVSFGLSLYGTGSLTVDNFTLVDQGPVPPAVTLTSPADGSFVRGTANLTATASSTLGIDHVEFAVRGATVGVVSATPYTMPWSSTTLPDGPILLAARAVDRAGTVATSNANVTVANGAGLLLNPSLEKVNASGVPGCWQRVAWGTNTAAWTLTSDAHDGSFAQRVDVTAYSNGGNRLMPNLDSGPCAPPGTPGHTYTITGWYKSTAQPQLVTTYRNASGQWVWWSQTPALPAAGNWSQVTYTTPALPAGATAVSFGITLYSTGSLTVDQFGLKMN